VGRAQGLCVAAGRPFADAEIMDTKLLLPLGVAAVGVLLAVAIPNCIRARGGASQNSCLANLKIIEGAKASWAMEHGITNRAVEPQAADLFGASKYVREVPACFLNGMYSIGKLSERPRCSVPEHTL
jgi:competence protein ComGC